MFKRRRFPVEIILLCVRWYCKYGIDLRCRRFVACSHMCALFLLLLHDDPALGYQLPSSTVASDSNLSPHLDWNQLCQARVEAVKGKRVDLIFLGDSITQNWTGPDWGGERRGSAVWDEYYAPRFGLNFGVGADKTQNLLWRMDHMPISKLHPEIAVVMIGVNNYEYPAQAIADGTRAVIKKTQQMFPGIKIILVSILPNRIAYQKMMDVNAITRRFADGRSIFYLDLVPLFVPTGNNWIGMGADHLHPNETGYLIWAKAMAPLLDQLLPQVSQGGVPGATDHAATIGADREETWWKERHKQILSSVAQHADTQLLMIGDSITNNYDKENPPDENFKPIWNQYYESRKALNLGFSGDTTANVLWRLNHGEIDGLHPAAAVVLIGTNNTGWKQQTAAETEAGIDAVVAQLRHRLPATQILLMAILPSDLAASVINADQDINEYLSERYMNQPYVHYLNIGYVFFKDRRLDTTMFYDPRLKPPGHALHPDTNGQRKVAEAIEPLLSTLIHDAAKTY